LAAVGIAVTATATTPVAAAQSSTDPLGRPNQQILDAATSWANTLPAPLKEKVLAAVDFFGDPGEGKVPLEGPVISQFLWPT
ncbi:hypothetical protein QP187_24590, partial [Escherichia coli]|nr:hypothetical protein [Escherichia coli]